MAPGIFSTISLRATGDKQKAKKTTKLRSTPWVTEVLQLTNQLEMLRTCQIQHGAAHEIRRGWAGLNGKPWWAGKNSREELSPVHLLQRPLATRQVPEPLCHVSGLHPRHVGDHALQRPAHPGLRMGETHLQLRLRVLHVDILDARRPVLWQAGALLVLLNDLGAGGDSRQFSAE